MILSVFSLLDHFSTVHSLGLQLPCTLAGFSQLEYGLYPPLKNLHFVFNLCTCTFQLILISYDYNNYTIPTFAESASYVFFVPLFCLSPSREGCACTLSIHCQNTRSYSCVLPGMNLCKDAPSASLSLIARKIETAHGCSGAEEACHWYVAIVHTINYIYVYA